MIREKEGVQRHANDLAEKLEEKTAAQDKLQTLYGNLKMKVQTDQARNAATIEPAVQPTETIRSHQSFNDPQFDTASLPPLLTARKQHHQSHSRNPVDVHGAELLHPFQRSGSARGQTSSELAAQNMMPPPLRSNNRDLQHHTNGAATPAQRVSLSRAERNYTFPQASARQSMSQHFPVQSVDRRTAQHKARYQSQFQQTAGQNMNSRTAANRSTY